MISQPHTRRSFWFSAFLAGTVLAVASSGALAETRVSDGASLEKAISAAEPGDLIVLKDGQWTDIEIRVDRPGTASAPLQIRAQTPGGVILNGTSRLTLAAPHVHVEGLYFKEGALAGGALISFRSDYCQVSDCAIVNYNPPNDATQYYWVFFDGSHNRLQRCLLDGKSHHGPVIGNAIQGARHNTVAECYIKDIAPSRRNGMEIFRIWGYGGNEEIGEDGAFFTIESNLLERAHGESSEIISFKSNRNRVVNNTIRDTRGGITFRSGNYNIVSGNFILGDGRRGAYGMRVTGRHHAITNNYITDCDYGIDFYAGDFIDEDLSGRYGGIQRAGTPLGRVPMYSWPRYVLVAQNTLVNNGRYDLHLGGGYKSGWPRLQRVLWPAANIIANNLVIKPAGGAAVRSARLDRSPPLDRFDFLPNSYFGNVTVGGTVEYEPARAGFVERDLDFGQDEYGIYRLSDETAAIKAGRKMPGAEVAPHDSQPMADAPGVGAEEFSAPSARSRPLTSADVGPDWFEHGTEPGAGA